MTRPVGLLVLAVATAVAGADLTVYQGLDELTARLPRLATKPLEATIDAANRYAPETVIFHDTETGREVWALTCDLSKDLANIERRCPWNADGSILSFKGNRAFRDATGVVRRQTWDGYSYLMRGDGSQRVKFRAISPAGGVTDVIDKFNIWDRRDPRVLYFVLVQQGDTWRPWWSECPRDAAMWLVRVRVGDDLLDNRVEPLCRFPNARRKLIQAISDTNRLCIQDVNGRDMADMPSFYVVDASRSPGDPALLRAHSLSYGIRDVPGHDPGNEYRVHQITISRDGRTVSWGYGSMTEVGETVGFSVPADDLDAIPQAQQQATDPWGQYLSHPDAWVDGRIAYFSGPTAQLKAAGVTGGWGVWVRLPGQPPAFLGPPASGGHVTWCGGDPEVFFANISRPEPGKWDTPVKGRIVAGRVGAAELEVLCNPYDRWRGGRAGYDAIPRAIQSPDATKCWFHSSLLMPTDETTGSFLVVYRRPAPPVALTAEPGPGRVTLRWQPPAVRQEIRGYRVYREGVAGWQEITTAPVAGERLPVDLPAGEWRLAVTSEEHSRLESDRTSPSVSCRVAADGTVAVRPADPVVGWDTTPPAPPAGLAAVREAAGVRLAGQPSPAADLRHYHLYASSTAPPDPVQAHRILSPTVDLTAYLDWAAGDGRVWYALTAVDRQGHESAPVRAEVP